MHVRNFVAAAMMLVSTAALAADNSVVVLPLGTLVTQALAILQPLILSLAGAAATWLFAKLGPDLGRALYAAHVDQVLSRAIDAGFAFVEGAEKGKVLEIPVANEVIRNAAQYLLDQAPGLFKELGANLGQMLISRLSAAGALPANASAANLDISPSVVAKKASVRA